jgi:hypothetical protein
LRGARIGARRCSHGPIDLRLDRCELLFQFRNRAVNQAAREIVNRQSIDAIVGTGGADITGTQQIRPSGIPRVADNRARPGGSRYLDAHRLRELGSQMLDESADRWQ